MAKINPNFQHSIYEFLHKPLRDIDSKKGQNFLERFLVGMQNEFENMQGRINTLSTLNDPATIRADLLLFLKDIVGFTNELNNITQDLSENDLRKLITLAVALWKQKGTETGYANIIRLFVGKTARIFNWFDFRFIVGEKAFGEEQLGEDSWLISVPGVEGSSDTSNNVVALFTFEGNLKDRSLTQNDANGTSPFNFYSTPPTGFPAGSEHFIAFQGGVATVNNSSQYDLSGDFTIEFFFKSNISEGNKTIVYKLDGSGKGFKIEIDKAAKTVSYTVSDGTVTLSDSLVTTFDLDNGVLRHIALMVDRANDGVRLWVNGTESTAKTALGLLGDVTNFAKMFLGGEGVGINTIKADMDNFRLALNSVYDVDTGTVTPPLSGFIEFQEEQLDEFKTDIRIVDDGTGNLNKTLILRILNLMRPVSERLNVIFIRFFDDFVDGIGQFDIAQGSASVNNDFQMVLTPSTVVNTSVFGDDDFQDIVLQVKANETIVGGGIFSVLFFFQDIDNYYEFRIDTILRVTSLHKNVAGVSSVISTAVIEDIVPQASYIYTIVTDLSLSGGDTTIKAYVDSNKQHEIVDSSFTKGKFGMKTDASTTMQIDEIEMMIIPTDVQTVEPGFDL